VKLRSIGTRLVLLTGLVIVVTVALVVWQWASTDRAALLAEARQDARSLAIVLGRALMNEVDDANWKQVANNLDLVLQDDGRGDRKIVYIIIHGDEPRERRSIVAAVPDDIAGYIPDVVPLAVTRSALATRRDAVITEAPMLRDLTFRSRVLAHRGDRIAEAAIDMHNSSGVAVGTVRVAISTVAADQAAAAAIARALKIGAAAFLLALIGAFAVARTLARPIKRLAREAARIASGDLAHRVNMTRGDEIGRLATAFDDMAEHLEVSFNILKATAASFERFVPRKFLSVVAPDGIENIMVGTAEPRRIAVLFSDIRSFTRLSEQMTPAEVFELLNIYLGRMGGEIDIAGGFVDKYIGDAIMALFDDEHTDGLLRAAVGMRRALTALNDERRAQGKPTIEAGIGCHGGDVVMGTIGFASKIESTVIGDPVNVASRVEAMTKDYKVAVLVTGEIVARLRDRDAFPLRLLEAGVAVRGRVDPIDLYTLTV
jgi:class 3 adenylate cyclase